MTLSVLLLIGGALLVSVISLFATRSPIAEPPMVSPIVYSDLSTETGVFIPNLSKEPRDAYFYLRRDQSAVFMKATSIENETPTSDGSTRWAGLNFIGANTSPKVVGLEPLETVTGFRAIRYHGLYEGIDLMVSADADKLSGTFIVAPGADPSLVLFAVDFEDGSLVGAPMAYHEINGHRIPLMVSFEPARYGSTQLNLGPHEVVEPVMVDFDVKF